MLYANDAILTCWSARMQRHSISPVKKKWASYLEEADADSYPYPNPDPFPDQDPDPDLDPDQDPDEVNHWMQHSALNDKGFGVAVIIKYNK